MDLGYNILVDNKLLNYISADCVQVNLKNIFTKSRILCKGMRLLKIESEHYDPIEILEIKEKPEGYVNIKIRELKSGRISEISHLLDTRNKYFVWWLLDPDYFLEWMEEMIMMRLIVGNTD